MVADIEPVDDKGETLAGIRYRLTALRDEVHFFSSVELALTAQEDMLAGTGPRRSLPVGLNASPSAPASIRGFLFDDADGRPLGHAAVEILERSETRLICLFDLPTDHSSHRGCLIIEGYWDEAIAGCELSFAMRRPLP